MNPCPPLPFYAGDTLSTRSFIARPTESGYDGIYIRLDGSPSEKLPFLLTAYQYRFQRDEKAMARHLVDGTTIGWDELGTDLLDGAPSELVTALTDGDQWPSTTLDHLVTPDGSPPVRMSVTERTAPDQDLDWGYILRPNGIEVINPRYAAAGPIVRWDADPRGDFTNPATWPLATERRPLTAPPTVRRSTTAGKSHAVARR
ncbi:hypothetical protein DDV98_27130 [Streptomyces sp. IB2014 011-12]|nr:hypothetical protein DDV98_27130 [Streptomyces sp. IB2014 011-12]